jgi:hypothetical protein
MLRFIVVITFAFVFFSCSNNSTNSLAVFRATEEGLQRSNETITELSNTIYRALDDRLTNPRTAMHANIWQPKAMIIKQKSSEVINYIEALVFKEDDLDAASRLFDKNKGKELYEKLKNYKKEMLAIDPEINNQFGENSLILTKDFEADSNKQKEFVNTFFKNSPTIAVLAMLRKFENNAKIIENKFVEFCLNKIRRTDEDGHFTKFSIMVVQSTNIIKGGGQMQIQAGVGAFTVMNKPEITIDNKKIQIDDSRGVALYKFKSPLKTGKYTVPVKIEYTDVDGTKKTVMGKVEYTVME